MVNLMNKIFNIFQTVQISIINVINILYDLACKMSIMFTISCMIQHVASLDPQYTLF